MIEILNYTTACRGKKIGFFDVFIKKFGLVFRRLSHMQSGKSRWIDMPKFSIDQDGKRYYCNYVEFQNSNHTSDLLDQINEALKEYIKEKNIVLPEPLDLSGDPIV